MAIFCGTLYAIYQRTQSESKSQPFVPALRGATVCMQSIKEHNLKANHNTGVWIARSSWSVCNLSKNTIWKQITTAWAFQLCGHLCMQSIKEHNLKANHNGYIARVKRRHLYAIYQRTQSESKSQPVNSYLRVSNFCMQSIKEHNLKANHNC